jgi:arginase
VTRKFALIGVPTSAGAFAPGQEHAPAALRAAGLVSMLRGEGLAVHDRGDSLRWRWRPDRDNPRAQNLEKVVEIVKSTAARVGDAIAAGEIPIVLGGDCTVGIGTVAAQAVGDSRVGLVYLDSHADLNVPTSVTEGALDWMGLAHMIGESGAEAALVNAGDRVPILQPNQVVLLGWGHDQATEFERDVIDRHGIAVVPADDVKHDPIAAADAALELLDPLCDKIVVHFDADVIDFTDMPLSENTGRNEGVFFEDALRTLDVLLASPKFAGLTITEINPDHVEEGANTLEKFIESVSSSLAKSFATPSPQ